MIVGFDKERMLSTPADRAHSTKSGSRVTQPTREWLQREDIAIYYSLLKSQNGDWQEKNEINYYYIPKTPVLVALRETSME